MTYRSPCIHTCSSPPLNPPFLTYYRACMPLYHGFNCTRTSLNQAHRTVSAMHQTHRRSGRTPDVLKPTLLVFSSTTADTAPDACTPPSACEGCLESKRTGTVHEVHLSAAAYLAYLRAPASRPLPAHVTQRQRPIRSRRISLSFPVQNSHTAPHGSFRFRRTSASRE